MIRLVKLLARHVALAFAVSLAAPAAVAQTDSENRAAARELGREGIQLAEAGKCAEAVDRLARAEQLFHAPSILARLGECQVELGKLVEGTENLNRVVREELPPDAPKAFREAQKRAKSALERALPRIPRLTVIVQAPAGVSFEVRVDGRVLPGVLVGVERPIDPGSHDIAAAAAGHQPASTRLTIAEGARETVTLALTPDPAAAAATGAPRPNDAVSAAPAPPLAPSAATAPPSASSPESASAPRAGVAPDAAPRDAATSGTSRTLGYVSLGVGAVGLAIGAAFGVTATGKKSELDDVCNDGRCPASSESDIDAMNSAATLSTIGFAVGAVGIGLGAVLLISAPRRAAAGGVRPWVGLGAAGLRGRF